MHRETKFIFNDPGRDNPHLTAYNYQLYKSLVKKMKYKKLRDEIDSELCMTYCKFRELCQLMGFKEIHSPETYGITEAQVKYYLLNDKFITANLLLKVLAEEKNQAIKDSRNQIVKEFNEKMKPLKLFTKNGQKKFDKEMVIDGKQM